MTRRQAQLALILMFALASGANCPRRFAPSTAPSPVAFGAPPSLEQVRDFLVAQSSRVQRLQITSGRLNVAGAPALSTSLALERPRRLRMQAGLGFTGTEIDLGSNDTEFWFWAKRNEPPGVYFASHLDATTPAVTAMLPVPPSWLIEAFGLIEFDPQAQYQGPFQRSPEQLEIRAVTNGVQGPVTKVLLIDSRYGHVVEQSVYDQAGRIIAQTRGSQYEYVESAGVSLPRRIDVQLPTMPMEFTLEVDGYVVNQLTSDPSQLWVRPEYPGYPTVNLATGQASASAAVRSGSIFRR